MQLHLDMTSTLKAQLAVVEQSASVAIGRERDRVEAPGGLEAGKSRLVATLHTREECFEGFIQPAKNILAAGKVREREAAIGTHRLQLIRLIVIVYRLAANLPCSNALFERGIVKRARLAQFTIQEGDLASRGIQPVFVRDPHLVVCVRKNADYQVSGGPA